MSDFLGKHALVTGGSRGLGSVLVRSLLRNGAQVTACGLDPEGPAEEERLHYVSCDLAQVQAPAKLAAAARGRFGPIDILVNNAASVLLASPWTVTVEEFDHAMAVNVRAAWQLSMEAAADMARRGGGAIVNVGSTNIYATRAAHFPYSVSKGALGVLTKALAVEFGPKGIRVNSVLPGIIRTQNYDTFVLRQPAPGAFEAQLRDSHCLDHLPSPEEVAAAIVFLVSDAASGVTGTELLVDGGRQVKRYP